MDTDDDDDVPPSLSTADSDDLAHDWRHSRADEQGDEESHGDGAALPSGVEPSAPPRRPAVVPTLAAAQAFWRERQPAAHGQP